MCLRAPYLACMTKTGEGEMAESSLGYPANRNKGINVSCPENVSKLVMMVVFRKQPMTSLVYGESPATGPRNVSGRIFHGSL